MKEVPLDSLKPDPVAAALFTIDDDHVIINGYLNAKDEMKLTIGLERGAKTYLEIPRFAVLSVFEDKHADGLLRFVVKGDATIKTVTAAKAVSTLSRMRDDSEGCAITCSSENGDQTCCCRVGERCVRTVGTCRCEDASRLGGGFVGPIGGEAVFGGGTAVGGQQPGSAGAAGRPAQAASLNWQCTTERGICPIICYPIIVNGKIVDYWCICDCTNPVPWKNAIG